MKGFCILLGWYFASRWSSLYSEPQYQSIYSGKNTWYFAISLICISVLYFNNNKDIVAILYNDDLTKNVGNNTEQNSL